MTAATAAALVALLLAAAVLLAEERGPGGRRPPPGGPSGWVRRRRAGPPPDEAVDVPLLLELVAAAVSAGLPPGRALDEALGALPAQPPAELVRVAAALRLGADPVRTWARVEQRWQPLADPLLLSARTGAGTAVLLRSAADQCRAERRRAAAEAAARLGSLLVLPLGLCTLPSFLLLGVVPVVLSLAGQVLGG